jgi:glycosyltransferase involved in cell wall biosynthesis
MKIKKKPTKILILASPKISQMEHTILSNLGRMVKTYFELHLLCGTDSNYNNLTEFYSIHPGKVWKIDIGDFRYAINSCSRVIREINPDLLVNASSPANLGFVISLFSKRYKIPCIIRMTGDSFREAKIHNQSIKKLKSWILHGQMARSAYKRADFICALGEKFRSDLIYHKYKPEKIIVLPQPFDRRLFTRLNIEKKIQRKIEIGLDPNRKTVLFVGRLSWLKGVDRVLEIIDEINLKKNALQFCIVGTGEYENYFKRFPSELVHMAGVVSHNNVSRYFQAADLFIFPSRTEGLPNVILEALSCGVPVIAAPVGDIPNWVSNLATEPNKYVKHILDRDYVIDDLPEVLDYERLKKAYINLFHMVALNRA